MLLKRWAPRFHAESISCCVEIFHGDYKVHVPYRAHNRKMVEKWSQGWSKGHSQKMVEKWFGVDPALRPDGYSKNGLEMV